MTAHTHRPNRDNYWLPQQDDLIRQWFGIWPHAFLCEAVSQVGPTRTVSSTMHRGYKLGGTMMQNRARLLPKEGEVE